MEMILNGDMIWYLAHPYKAESKVDMHDNYRHASMIAASLLELGLIVFSPISHSHPIAICGDLDQTSDFWYQFDERFFRVCGGIILCDGWENSHGCCYERNAFQAAGKPVLTYKEINISHSRGELTISKKGGQ
jgi:nucleoside 2-deoxyribosyltransferase